MDFIKEDKEKWKKQRDYLSDFCLKLHYTWDDNALKIEQCVPFK